MTQSTPEKEWLPFHRTAILRKHLLMCIPASSGTPSGLVYCVHVLAGVCSG